MLVPQDKQEIRPLKSLEIGDIFRSVAGEIGLRVQLPNSDILAISFTGNEWWTRDIDVDYVYPKGSIFTIK